MVPDAWLRPSDSQDVGALRRLVRGWQCAGPPLGYCSWSMAARRASVSCRDEPKEDANRGGVCLVSRRPPRWQARYWREATALRGYGPPGLESILPIPVSASLLVPSLPAHPTTLRRPRPARRRGRHTCAEAATDRVARTAAISRVFVARPLGNRYSPSRDSGTVRLVGQRARAPCSASRILSSLAVRALASVLYSNNSGPHELLAYNGAFVCSNKRLPRFRTVTVCLLGREIRRVRRARPASHNPHNRHGTRLRPPAGVCDAQREGLGNNGA